MRILAILPVLVMTAALSAAQAQDVTVNPSAGGRVLIDPATGQPRYVPALLEPGEDMGPIHLHMPRHHHTAPSQTAATELPAEATAPAPPPAPARKHHPARPVRQAVEQPIQPATPVAAPNDLNDLANLAAASPANPEHKAKPAAEPRMANADVPPARTRTTQSTAKDTILFALNASDPSTSAIQAIRALAAKLDDDLMNADARVQLMAYGGPRGEKSSDTRRLSLKRALVVRQLLIDDGVPSERIDVRAMGGVEDDGPTDRVDVFLKS
ncbi:MAG: OmpA family protein [Alphaproteobacteria bacterium]|nr:OmpA family protein [Alphaproteobacteria bacterium]